ncbi:MAG: patatin-like phospholipase family protein, partial [Mobilitalea sp.]
GTSAGAVMAALLAGGYTGKELFSMSADMDLNKLLDRDWIQAIPLLGKPLGLLLEKGMYQGDCIEEWMQQLLEAKGKTKFKDVMFEGKSRLKIIASDITNREILILPDDLPKYGIDPLEFDIARAVRMSAAIPLYFNPIKLKYKNCMSYIVDGGVLSNFPVWIFDVDSAPRWPTFGFKLVEPPASNCSMGKTDLLSYVFDIFEAMVEEDQSVFMRDKDSIRTISIPTLGIKSTDFNISLEDSLKLYLSGYESCERFLKQWDSQDYIRKYRR